MRKTSKQTNEADHPNSSERLKRRKIPQPVLHAELRRFPAWIVSVVFHVVVLTTLAVVWRAQAKGTNAEKGGPVGIAIVHQASGGGEEFFLSDSASSGQAESEAATADAVAALPNPAEVGSPADSLLDALLPSGDGPAGETLAAAGSLGLGEGGSDVGGSGAIPKVKTTVFGIEGEGTRFLYVFDRSDSMNGFGGKPLRTAKAELLTSLDSLGRAHQFQIIFYNDSPLPFGGFQQTGSARGPQMLRGDETSKNGARKFVSGVSATGGTQHIDALRLALMMNPDVIFFLTDADQPSPSSVDIEKIHASAARGGTTIHTIQFGSGGNQNGGGWIRYLAEGTTGKYRYIDVSLF